MIPMQDLAAVAMFLVTDGGASCAVPCVLNAAASSPQHLERLSHYMMHVEADPEPETDTADAWQAA